MIISLLISIAQFGLQMMGILAKWELELMKYQLMGMAEQAPNEESRSIELADSSLMLLGI